MYCLHKLVLFIGTRFSLGKQADHRKARNMDFVITDLGVVRECAGQGIGTALVRKLHELAGGEENIIMYTCFNENAYGFYEKLGMHKPDDVVVLNKVEWTDFTVE